MPKVRGDEVAEALEELEQDKELGDDDGDEGWYSKWNELEGDFYVTASGVVKVGDPVLAKLSQTLIDDNDPDAFLYPEEEVDPAIWPLMMKLLRALPKDEDDSPQVV